MSKKTVVWDPSYFSTYEVVGIRLEYPYLNDETVANDILVRDVSSRGFAYWYISYDWWDRYRPWADRNRFKPTGVNVSMILYNLDEVRSERATIPGPRLWVTTKKDLFAEDWDSWSTPAPAPPPAGSGKSSDSPMSSTGKTAAIAIPLVFVSLCVLGFLYVRLQRRKGITTHHPRDHTRNSAAAGSGPTPPTNPPLSGGGGGGFLGGLFSEARRANGHGSGYGIPKNTSERVGVAGPATVGTTRVDSDPPPYEEAIRSGPAETGAGAGARAGGGGVVDDGVFELTDRSSWSPTVPTRIPTSPPTYESDYSPPQVGRENSNGFRDEAGRQQQERQT